MCEKLRNSVVFFGIGFGVFSLAVGAAISGARSADHIAAFASVMTLLVTLGGVVVASTALETWRMQVRGAARLNVAIDIADAIGTLKIEIQNQRAPMIQAHEYPNSRPPEPNWQDELVGTVTWHVYERRFEHFYKSIRRVHELRGKALTVLDANSADALVNLARVAMGVKTTWQHYCALIQRGRDPNAPHADELRRFRDMSMVPQDAEPTDDLSQRFNVEFEAAMRCLRPYLGLTP